MIDFTTYSHSGESIASYGLELVKNSFSIDNNFIPFSQSTNKELILYNLYFNEQIFDLTKFINQRSNKFLVGGNVATANPSIPLALGADVYLGDGEKLFNLDSDYILKSGTIPDKPIDRAFQENINPILFEDIQQNKRTFIEIARGCRNKCSFCQYGWAKPYRSANVTDIEHCLIKAKTKSIRAFSADRMQHEAFSYIEHLFKKYGKNNTASDVSIRSWFENQDKSTDLKKFRTGIEGMSYRLRKMVGKNYTDDKLLYMMEKLIKSGVKVIDWYMIYGLPTECEKDIEEFEALLMRLDEIVPKDFVLAIHWNGFNPSSQSPFQWQKPAIELEHKKALIGFLNRPRFTKNLRVLSKPKATNEELIKLRTFLIRGSENSTNLIKTVSKGVSKFKKANNMVQLEKQFYKQEGFNFNDKLPYNFVFPWDKYVKYDKDKMMKVGEARIRHAKDELNGTKTYR